MRSVDWAVFNDDPAATSAMPPYDLGLSGTGNRRVAFFDLFYGKKREGLWAVLLLGTSNPTICL